MTAADIYELASAALMARSLLRMAVHHARMRWTFSFWTSEVQP
jgi:hypothetical protein